MSDDHGSDGQRLSDEEAHRLLARAAELDVGGASGLSVARLRQSAIDAGIAPAAFDAALRMEAVNRHLESRRKGSPPWWVRCCMFGVPDRRTATGIYWLFVAALCGSPFVVHPWAAAGPAAAAATALGAMSFPLFALWSTSRAIRWLDRHGWDTLG